jgi:hypothetical protein
MQTQVQEERTLTTPEPPPEAGDGEPSDEVTRLPKALLDLLEALADIC